MGGETGHQLTALLLQVAGITCRVPVEQEETFCPLLIQQRGGRSKKIVDGADQLQCQKSRRLTEQSALPQRGAVFFRSLTGVQHVMFLLFPSYLQRMQRQAVKLLIPGQASPGRVDAGRARLSQSTSLFADLADEAQLLGDGQVDA